MKDYEKNLLVIMLVGAVLTVGAATGLPVPCGYAGTDESNQGIFWIRVIYIIMLQGKPILPGRSICLV